MSGAATIVTAPDALQPSADANPPGLRERKKAETRAAIHEAALRLVAENGIANASVDAICSEAFVSSRTFFNYFPSKAAAILGRASVELTDAQREAFLAAPGEQNLVRDLCHLLGDITETGSGSRRGSDSHAVREVLARRPELVPELHLIVTEIRHELVELAAQRTTPERARLAVALVLSALTCALDSPLEPGIDHFDDWLFATVMTMHDIAGGSLEGSGGGAAE